MIKRALHKMYNLCVRKEAHENNSPASNNDDGGAEHNNASLCAIEFDRLISESLGKGDYLRGLSYIKSFWSDASPRKSVHSDDLAHIWRYFRAWREQCVGAIEYINNEYIHGVGEQDADIEFMLVYLELKTINDEYDSVIYIGGMLARRHAGDLRLEDIRARAWMLHNNITSLEEGIENGFAPFRKVWCGEPFANFTATQSGHVRVCCANWLNEPIGSFDTQSLDDIWNSPTAISIRRSVMDGSYQYCNKMTCPKLRYMKRVNTGHCPDSYAEHIIANNYLTSPYVYPRKIVLAEDPVCNLTCPSCRDKQITGNKSSLENFETHIFPGLLNENTSLIRVGGHGEAFASQHYIRLMKSIDPNRHRIKKIQILTNGVLFSKKMWDGLANLHNMNIVMSVSIDAATEKTYNIVRRGGNWRKLQNSLSYMCQLRSTGAIKRLNFNFVVQATNFREIPDFVEMAKSFDVDGVFFALYQITGPHISRELFAEQAVFLPFHNDYAELNSILNCSIMNDPIVHFPSI